MKTILEDLIDMIANSNIHTVSYNAEHDEWTITYRNGLPLDKVPSDLLVEFIQNA